VEDMMLLCPNHHREATLGAMPETEQRYYKANPYNQIKDLAKGSLKILQSTLAMQLGSNPVVGDGIILEVDDFPLLELGLSDEKIVQVTVSLYDQSDTLLALIERNEWITGDPLPWDLEFGTRWIKVRERKGRVSLIVDARRFPISVQGRLWHKGHGFRINKAGIIIDGEQARGGGVQNLGLVASRLRLNTEDHTVELKPDPRFGQMVFVSDPSLLMRTIKSVQAWQSLKYPNLLLRT